MDICIADAAPASLHLLQGCKINFNGQAPVSEYFKPTQTGTQSDGTPLLEAAFRGRFMKGCEMPLPEGFSGVVLEHRESSAEEGPPAGWHATSTFSSFTYWNHDNAPASTDGVRRAMEWAALASQIHKPIDPDEVAQEVAAAAATAGGETTAE